jgi:hypothetical protein
MHDQFVIDHNMGIQPEVEVDQEPNITLVPYESESDVEDAVVRSIDSGTFYNDKPTIDVSQGQPADVVSDFEEEPQTPPR